MRLATRRPKYCCVPLLKEGETPDAYWPVLLRARQTRAMIGRIVISQKEYRVQDFNIALHQILQKQFVTINFNFIFISRPLSLKGQFLNDFVTNITKIFLQSHIRVAYREPRKQLQSLRHEKFLNNIKNSVTTSYKTQCVSNLNIS